ncbi:hypothetical protein [Sphingomonas sp. SRS2]|uniref:hypothetical protein n=1 Tax=Sphingomonas sp. SRS2 TaxID=133190 RepID=UPI0006184EBA|nr:hypothetical protein [Sphingomonas sp. SRS2]KKC25828.1 hypothetical protein WP12_12300 [Sphingomonas sp. SRS2]
MGFPKAVYRDGTDFDWDGRMVDHRRIGGEDELTAALADGWLLPRDFLTAPKAEKTLLDKTAAEIIAEIPSLSGEALLELLEAEEKGKTRKGVLAAIKDAIEKLVE